MRFKNYILIGFILILLGGCNSNSNIQKVTLMLDYTPNTNHTGLYVGKDKGFYEAEGLDLEIVSSSAASITQSVAQGVVDFGITYEEDITLAQNEGLDNLKSIYAILSENTSGFMSYKDKEIKTPEDFAGKTYCGWGSEVEEEIVKAVAENYGVNSENITIALTQTDFLRSNKNDCDFFWEYEGWAGVEAKDEGIEYNYISLKDEGYDFYSPIIVTSDEFIESNSQAVQSFVNATIKGYTYAYEHPDEAAQIFLDNNPSYDKQLIKDSQNYLSPYYISDNQKAGYQKDEVWGGFTNFLYESDIVDTNEYKELYTNEYVDNYYES